jgi:hypothetical protein
MYLQLANNRVGVFGGFLNGKRFCFTKILYAGGKIPINVLDELCKAKGPK